MSCKTPANVERELRLHFLVRNLVRRLMLEAARQQRAPWGRISFAGALGAARLQVSSARQRQRLMAELLRALADDPVPDRPDRREPRALKRRPKPYPHLTCHRHRYKEVPHPSKYWNDSVRKRRNAKNQGLN